MALLSAQVSLYPLRSPHLGPAIRAFVAALQDEGLKVGLGPLSTFVEGEAARLFGAVAKAFAAAAEKQQVVMSLTVSNACPGSEAVPGPSAGPV